MLKLLFVLLLNVTLHQQKVYVCLGPTAYAYHNNRNCRGLSECSHKIDYVTITEAVSMKRKACGYCYKNTQDKSDVTSNQCKAITKKGTRCSRKAGPSGYCYQH